MFEIVQLTWTSIQMLPSYLKLMDMIFVVPSANLNVGSSFHFDTYLQVVFSALGQMLPQSCLPTMH